MLSIGNVVRLDDGFRIFGQYCQLWQAFFILTVVETASSAYDSTAGSVNVEPVEDLQMVILVWRHGDRAPLSAYPADPDAEKNWYDGFEQITPQGIEQHYRLGQYLHQRYSLLLKDIRKTQIYAESSGYTRTLASAATDMAAIFPPTESMGLWNSGDSLSSIWQPLPVFSRPTDQDAVFAISYCNVLAEDQQYPLSLASELGYTDLMNFLSNKTGLAPNTFPVSFYQINDILYCNAQHGHPQPSWATADIIQQTKFWADATLRLVQGGRKGQNFVLSKALRSGVMIEQIAETLTARLNSSSKIYKDDLRFYIFSGHDTNIAGLMAVMQLFDYDNVSASPLTGIPEYASSIFFELFRNNTVRMILRNNPPENFDRAPVVIKHPDCDVFCPIDRFVQLTAPYFMTETGWFHACNRTVDPNFDISKYPFLI